MTSPKKPPMPIVRFVSSRRTRETGGSCEQTDLSGDMVADTEILDGNTVQRDARPAMSTE